MRTEHAAGTRGDVEAPAAGHIHSSQVGKAALWGGEAWLTERWCNVVVTSQSRQH